MPAAISHYWAQSDQFGHAIAYLLLLMSLVSWTLLFTKAWSFWRIRRAAPAIQTFWSAPTMHDALVLLQRADHERLFASMATAAVNAAEQPQQGMTLSSASNVSDISDLLTRILRQELQKAAARLENGLTILASIGATAPFVGLLGTVWGIYHALSSISASGLVQIDQLAGPVGEALIMTAFGLMVAIPAVLAFNAFNRINRITLAELDGFAHDLHAHLTKHYRR